MLFSDVTSAVGTYGSPNKGESVQLPGFDHLNDEETVCSDLTLVDCVI